MSLEREKAATPTLDKSFTDTFSDNLMNESNNAMNESTMSGYDGDKEDESFVNG